MKPKPPCSNCDKPAPSGYWLFAPRKRWFCDECGERVIRQQTKREAYDSCANMYHARLEAGFVLNCIEYREKRESRESDLSRHG